MALASVRSARKFARLTVARPAKTSTIVNSQMILRTKFKILYTFKLAKLVLVKFQRKHPAQNVKLSFPTNQSPIFLNNLQVIVKPSVTQVIFTRTESLPIKLALLSPVSVIIQPTQSQSVLVVLRNPTKTLRQFFAVSIIAFTSKPLNNPLTTIFLILM